MSDRCRHTIDMFRGKSDAEHYDEFRIGNKTYNAQKDIMVQCPVCSTKLKVGPAKLVVEATSVD